LALIKSAIITTLSPTITIYIPTLPAASASEVTT